jgi:hypothetical protein
MRPFETPRFWLMAGLVFGAAALRLLPHPPNFTPIAAIALFGGAQFERKRWAFAVPLAAMALSDAVLRVLFGWGFDPVVYAAFALIVCLGFLLRNKRTAPLPVAGASLAAATIFYLTTNFAVWAASGMYSKTLAGLVTCYVAAIPFFGPTVAGDLFYSAVLFGGFALVQKSFPILRERDGTRPQIA